MRFLPKIIIIFTFWAGFFLISFSKAIAVEIASQNQYDSSNTLNTWQALQELGNNLSGTAQSFTFKVNTSKTNLEQFDYTALNSKIYDKDNANSYISGCTPTGSSANPIAGLIFNTTNVPQGYEDVVIDFSCRNYNFISGHRYLIIISNANLPQFGGKRIQFTTTRLGISGQDNFTTGGLRFAFDNSSCFPTSYIWNSQSNNSGCNILTSPKDDLYFILSNTSPPPKTPVIFIPGIGGSEFKASQDIIWSSSDGHGGTFSHAYSANEKIWVNKDEAAKLGNDDYFDVLRIKEDGITPEASLSLTNDLTSFGYSDIDSFFSKMGYVKENNFFIFPYDWRKDVRTTKDDLDALIEKAKQKSGQAKVNLVVHSLGGLVARYYISDATKATKVNKLIELGVPHLGATSAIKALIYGEPIGRWYFKIINIGVNGNEVKDVIQNLPSQYSLIPSVKYYDFYGKSINDPSPFLDNRDIDKNKIIGSLNYDQTKSLLSNLNYNMTAFNFGEQFHNILDPIFNQTNGVKIYEIVGSSQPTLGQIQETWLITWPINLIPKTEEIYINGDDTVPLYSASLKNDYLDISGATKIYYTQQRHGDLPSESGIAMQTVKSILNDDNSLPTEVKDQKITLEGRQISLDDGELDLYDDQNKHCGLKDDGEIEENIPDIFCTTSGNTKNAFVKKKVSKVKVTANRKKASINSKTTTLKIRTYKQDKISKTAIYKDIPINQTSKIELTLDQTIDNSPALTFYPDLTKVDTTIITPTSEVSEDASLDQTSPTTKIGLEGAKDTSGTYNSPVSITLTGNDTDSGILRIEYSLDNGQTVQIYSDPFTISAPGKTTMQVKSIDKLGNEEIPQTITVEIAIPPSPAPTSSPIPTPTPTLSTSKATSSDNTNNTSKESEPTFEVSSNIISSKVIKQSLNPSPSSVLGISFENPNHVLENQEDSSLSKPISDPEKQILGGLLLVSGGIVTIALLGLLTTFNPVTKLFFRRRLPFVKPFPK